MRNIFQACVQAYAEGEPVALAMVIRASPPSRVGEKMLVYRNGSTEGRLGDDNLTNRVCEAGLAALSGGVSTQLAYVQSESGLVQAAPGDKGDIEIFIQVLKPSPTLLLIGDRETKDAVVVDPASNWPLFAEKARELITKDKVSVVFGCWTSVSRKSVLPVFKELDSILFYPVQYEGEESERNVFYTGAAPNQQAIPAVDYLMSKDGGEAKRWVLAGTDYVYPRTTNKILEAYLKSKGVKQEDIMINYTPFGHSDWQTIVADFKKFGSAGKKTAVVSTINGDANVPFYKELGNQGIKAKDIPVVAFSVGEEELAGIDTKPLVGHLAAWNYFMSLKNPENDAFKTKWADYARAKKLPGADKPLTNDPMEATYIGIYMWKQAVEKAKSFDPDKVIAAMGGQSFKAPSGFTVKMDEKNHHLHKSVFIGEVQADGQFKVVWKTPGPVKAQPWSPFIPENKGKKDEPERK